MGKIYAVIVVYNSDVNESESLINICKVKNHDICVIVVDNSTIENDNSQKCKDNGWVYLSKGQNLGLSKGYNLALDYLDDKKGIVIWFDDDTNITQKYFDQLSKAVEENPDVDVFAPIIMGQDGRFWSPNEAGFFKNKQLKNASDTIRDNRFNAINSCTAVRIEVYSNYRYNEKIFLDQVDQNFFEDQRELGRKFMKLDVVIHHNFSTKSKMENLDAVKKRYSLMIPDFLTFCDRGRLRLCLGYIKVFGWGVREGINYRSFSFLPWCMSEANKWKTNRAA